MYCLIFGQYLHVHLKKKKNERSIFIYPLAILFLLSTLDFFLNLLQTFWLVVSNICNTSVQILNWFLLTCSHLQLRPGTHQNFLRNADTISVAIYGFADIVSQAVLVFIVDLQSSTIFSLYDIHIDLPLLDTVESPSITSSCPNDYGINVVRWVITFINWWYLVLSMAAFSCLVYYLFCQMKGITLVVVIEMCRFEIVPRWTIILAISSICISLASNALVTGLLVLRLTLVHRQCRRAMAQAGRRPHDIQVSPVIMILIETGMMTFVSQLAFVIVLGFRNASAVVFGSPMVMVYVGSSRFELYVLFCDLLNLSTGNNVDHHHCASYNGPGILIQQSRSDFKNTYNHGVCGRWRPSIGSYTDRSVNQVLLCWNITGKMPLFSKNEKFQAQALKLMCF